MRSWHGRCLHPVEQGGAGLPGPGGGGGAFWKEAEVVPRGVWGVDHDPRGQVQIAG